MKQHYTVTIDQIIEEPWMHGDCKRTDENSHGGQCFIVIQEEEAAFVCGFFPLTTPRDRIHQAMKTIFGEKAFKEMNLAAIPIRWKPQAWSVIRDWMAQNDHSTVESIIALVKNQTTQGYGH